MNTSYRVTSTTGELLGIFSKVSLADAKALVDANPGAQVKPVVSIDTPCDAHPAYEAGNCPACGTSRKIGR